MKAIVATKKVYLPELPLEGHDPAAARKGERSVYWPDGNDYLATLIYAYESLRPGNGVEGPAILEGEYTTVVVPPAMRFSIDERGLGILER